MIRWEFAHAKHVTLELWDANKIEAETSEIPGGNELALVIRYNEVFVLVGTFRELMDLAARIVLKIQTTPQTVDAGGDDDDPD